MRIRPTYLLPFLAACGSVDSAFSLGDPIVTVAATLDVPPPTDVNSKRLRATLVWVNGLPTDPSAFGFCDGETTEAIDECERERRRPVQVSTSDIKVEMQFPLTVRLEAYELPTPQTLTIDGSEYDGASGTYSSLPEAEIVLYEDRNGNGKLDLLPRGQPGPAPDRVVALSSGRTPEGKVVRSSIIYKSGPIAPHPGSYYQLREAFFGPDADPSRQPPDGVYALRQTAADNSKMAQDVLLREHTLLSGSDFGEPSYFAMTFEVEPVENASIRLFPVDPQRRSWLARGCEPMFKQTLVEAEIPPAGTDVQCGRRKLYFASHPDDYCGQTASWDLGYDDPDFIVAPPPSWWPCDEQGLLKSETPYVAARKRLDDDPNDLGRRSRLIADGGFSEPVDFTCREGNIYHFDEDPDFRMPNVPIEPGSQVMCRSRDSLSYIPPRSDGCMFKFSYDLVPTSNSPFARSQVAWDLRATPPSWWPCDENGQLKSGTTYVAPRQIEKADCTSAEQPTMPEAPPPEGSRIACDGEMRFTYVPPWSDPCDPKRVIDADWFKLEDLGISSVPPGFAMPAVDPQNNYPWWPCDEQGQVRPETGYLPM